MSENKNEKVLVEQKNKLPLKVRIKSFIAGIQKHYRDKKKKFILFLKSDNFQIPKNAILKILMDGILFTIGLSFFLGFNWYLILVTGCGWYILKKEIFPELKQIISSLNIIKLNK